MALDSRICVCVYRDMEPHQIIDRARVARGLTLRAFARALDRSLPWAQGICDGGRIPYLSMARQIADVLRLDRCERRKLLEAVARVRLLRDEGLTAEQIAPMVAAAGGL